MHLECVAGVKLEEDEFLRKNAGIIPTQLAELFREKWERKNLIQEILHCWSRKQMDVLDAAKEYLPLVESPAEQVCCWYEKTKQECNGRPAKQPEPTNFDVPVPKCPPPPTICFDIDNKAGKGNSFVASNDISAPKCPPPPRYGH